MNAPKLRFKEYKGDWEKVKFDTLFKEKNVKSGDLDKYPLYSLTVKDGIVPKSERYERSFLVKKEENFKLVEPQNFVSNPMNMTIGALALYKGEKTVVVSGYYNVFQNVSEYKNQFLEDYLKSYKMIWLYKSIATGSLIEKQRVHYSQFKELIRLLPSIEEANKISDFFTRLDQRIEKQQEKVELLKAQKKGLMQKVFSQELRFKDENGQEYPKWKKEELSRYLLQHNEKTVYSDQYPALTSSRRGLFLQEDYFKKQVASENNTGYNVVPYGYFTYRHMSDDTTFYFNINYLVPKGIVSTLYPVFTTNEKLDSNFLMYLLNNSNAFKIYSLLQKQGGSRTYMYFNKLIAFSTELPCLAEQKKIASFLSDFDQKIEAEQAKLELLQKQKKGFMQQMFI